MLYKNLLLEKDEAWEIEKIVEKYYKNENCAYPKIFVHYADIPKIGIKPLKSHIKTAINADEKATLKSGVIFPYGVYGLPLCIIKGAIYGGHDEAFFGYRKYIFILKPKPNAKILYISELGNNPLEKWKKLLEKAVLKYKNLEPQSAFTRFLRKDLNIDVVVDNVGNILNFGVEDLETYQAVFLTPGSYEILNIFEKFDPQYGSRIPKSEELIFSGIIYIDNHEFLEKLRKFFKYHDLNPVEAAKIIKTFFWIKKELEYISGYKNRNNALIALFLMSKFPEYFHHLFIRYEKEMFRSFLRLRSIWENQENEKINRLKNLVKQTNAKKYLNKMIEKFKNLIYEKQQILFLKDILE